MATPSKRWTGMETICLMEALEKMDIMKRAAGRKHKNEDLFKVAVSKLVEEERRKKMQALSLFISSTELFPTLR